MGGSCSSRLRTGSFAAFSAVSEQTQQLCSDLVKALPGGMQENPWLLFPQDLAIFDRVSWGETSFSRLPFNSFPISTLAGLGLSHPGAWGAHRASYTRGIDGKKSPSWVGEGAAGGFGPAGRCLGLCTWGCWGGSVVFRARILPALRGAVTCARGLCPAPSLLFLKFIFRCSPGFLFLLRRAALPLSNSLF